MELGNFLCILKRGFLFYIHHAEPFSENDLKMTWLRWLRVFRGDCYSFQRDFFMVDVMLCLLQSRDFLSEALSYFL